jgi:hypothetical protein
VTDHGFSGVAYNSSNNRVEFKEVNRKNAGRTKQAGFPPAIDHLSSFPTEILQEQYKMSTGSVQDVDRHSLSSPYHSLINPLALPAFQ